MTTTAAQTSERVDSVFEHVTELFPAEEVHRLGKPTLLGLSWAIEDEFAARAERPVLFGAFQTTRYYEASRARWIELARVAEHAAALADFGGAPADAEEQSAGLARVDVPAGSPMTREWIVVCDSAELPAALLARELPGQSPVAEERRLFEALWTTEPDVVRAASRACALQAAAAGHPEAGFWLYHLAEQPRPSIVAPEAASRLFNRVVVHLDAASRTR
ncbi:hypothetical protein DT076_05520 [Desertihabitans brevis]|uniref:DICT domain-containing protein n=1 Tax=Desertihabitans brevis TaxID=2268447 RepID=A0A367YYB4_9ACTN|nr:DICT sensory domain-containing protein [Desertihabitans brevis]RCK70844.1 hypothetical protein DT076_05520 [Desertihabitans brevis]